jgi:hypothetical protein
LIGSNQKIPVDPGHISRQFQENPEAYLSLASYGLTSVEAVLPHFVAGGSILRRAVRTAPFNSLDHPRYEFFYPWDYAIGKDRHSIANHEFLLELKREASPGFLANLAKNLQDTARLRQTLDAEDLYLVSFQRFLAGMSQSEQYRVFDDVLSRAPWNDSLRARIYSLYRYIAATSRSPSERMRLMQRADSLYEERRPVVTDTR